MKLGGSDIGVFLNPSEWDGKIFLGYWKTPFGGRRQIIEPATGHVLHTVGIADPEDVESASRAAEHAQSKWAAVAPDERAAIIRKGGDLCIKHLDELAWNIARETGAILSVARHQIRQGARALHLASNMVLQPQGVTLPSASARLSYATRVPHGIVAVISPFNFPFILSLRAVAPALAMRNAVILKPDLHTPLSGGFMIAKLLQEAGLPEGVLQVLPGGDNIGDALCSERRVNMVSFTGSTATGRRVAELAGKHLKKVSLELGGKNSLVILEDADLERAASNIAWGAWLHQGQICMAAGRVIVHHSIADELTERLISKAANLKVGDPTNPEVSLGPLINEQQIQRVDAIVHNTVKAGAKLAAGGSFDKLFYRPTVLTGVRPGMQAFNEEIFGPVVNMVKFVSDDEAVDLANDTDYGLAAAVIGESLGRALALGSRLRAGLLHINDQTANDDGVNPFGGFGSSGNGSRSGNLCDMDHYSQWQWVTLKDRPPMFAF